MLTPDRDLEHRAWVSLARTPDPQKMERINVQSILVNRKRYILRSHREK